MKQGTLLLVLTAALVWTAGCQQKGWTEYDLGYCRLQLRGSFKEAAVRQAALEAEREGLPAYMTFQGGVETRALQINIEARFVEVSQQQLRVLGVHLWFGDEFLLTPLDFRYFWPPRSQFTIGGGVGIFGTRGHESGPDRYQDRSDRQDPITSSGDRHRPDGPRSVVGGTAGMSMTFSGPGGDSPTGFAAGFQWAPVDSTVAMMLAALERKKRGEVLSAPRVTLFGGQRPGVSAVTTPTYVETTPGPATQPVVASPFVPLVPDGYVVLEMVPLVSADRRYVTLAVQPQLTLIPIRLDFGDEPKVEPVRTQAQTQVIVKDAETVLIGGMIRKAEEVKDKIPALGEIPLLGRLFKSTRATRDESTLLILLKPTIIVE